MGVERIEAATDFKKASSKKTRRQKQVEDKERSNEGKKNSMENTIH